MIDEMMRFLAWDQRKDTERDTKFVELGRYLCEVREGQYWRLEKLKSFDEFLTRRFPEWRRKAFSLMSIHENLPPQARRQLKEIGWTKGLDLAKVARRDHQKFNCATWFHKAKTLPKDQFRRELTGQDTEPWELVYFKLYKSQVTVIDQAPETAALIAGQSSVARILPRNDLCGLSGRSKLGQRRSGNSLVLDNAILSFPARATEADFPEQPHRDGVVKQIRRKAGRLRLDPVSYENLRQQVLRRDSWRCQSCGAMSKSGDTPSAFFAFIRERTPNQT